MNLEKLQIVNIGEITTCEKLDLTSLIDRSALLKAGLIRHKTRRFKLLGKTEKDLPSKLKFEVDLISKSLQESLTKNGCEVSIK